MIKLGNYESHTTIIKEMQLGILVLDGSIYIKPPPKDATFMFYPPAIYMLNLDFAIFPKSLKFVCGVWCIYECTKADDVS